MGETYREDVGMMYTYLEMRLRVPLLSVDKTGKLERERERQTEREREERIITKW